MRISPNTKRNFFRIIPFAIIWLVSGYVFLITELLITNFKNLNPDAEINLDGNVFIFASLSLMLIGSLVGFIELVILEKRFKYYSFWKKILYKLLIYLSLMFLIIVVTYIIASSIELGKSVADPEVWDKFNRFLNSNVSISTGIQISFQLIISLIYAAISENLGHNVLFNFFSGKYHKPLEEERIFMFLDMKESTSIAEKLGPTQYFNLLQDYYELMSLPIINHLGEVYQYIGDEVVISWKQKQGSRDNNCIHCFFAIKENLKEEAAQFEKKFEVVPDFKAGVHFGKVTTGEVGALKKEIVYTGDVLNTAARIQGLCNNYEADLLVSKELLDTLEFPDLLDTKYIGDVELKGKKKIIKLANVIGSKRSISN